jgi:hypothetical protein
VFISIKLAEMAAKLADERCKSTHPQYGGICWDEGNRPLNRERLNKGDYPSSQEYWRILDRLAADQQP